MTTLNYIESALWKIAGFIFDILLFVGPLIAIVLCLCVGWRQLARLRSIWKWPAIILATALAIAWPFIAGVWLPDIFTFGAPHTLARVTGASGASYEVVQYWNYIDFYTTELRITSTDATKKVIELDGDDQKTWSVPITVDEVTGVATVILGGNRKIKVDLRRGACIVE